MDNVNITFHTAKFLNFCHILGGLNWQIFCRATRLKITLDRAAAASIKILFTIFYPFNQQGLVSIRMYRFLADLLCCDGSFYTVKKLAIIPAWDGKIANLFYSVPINREKCF
jgi:hypothetical protein